MLTALFSSGHVAFPEGSVLDGSIPAFVLLFAVPQWMPVYFQRRNATRAVAFNCVLPMPVLALPEHLQVMGMMTHVA